MILLTGKPNTGKSTAIHTLISLLGKRRCAGFYTEEILENGIRTGFRTHTLSGKDFVFAHIGFPKEYSVEDLNFGLVAEERPAYESNNHKNEYN